MAWNQRVEYKSAGMDLTHKDIPTDIQYHLQGQTEIGDCKSIGGTQR